MKLAIFIFLLSTLTMMVFAKPMDVNQSNAKVLKSLIQERCIECWCEGFSGQCYCSSHHGCCDPSCPYKAPPHVDEEGQAGADKWLE